MGSTRRRAGMGPQAFTLAIVASTLAGAALSAADWPQMGGEGRDYRPEAPTLAESWSEEGPKVLWDRPLGLGYSGIAVVGDRLFTLYRVGEEKGDEVVIAASAVTGETQWEHRYPAPYADYMRMEHGTGPHSTPLVVADLVFTVGIRGRLLALDRESGEVRWRRELVEEMGGTKLERGYSPSPMAHRDWIVLPVGGEGQGMVAFERNSGEIAWRSEDFGASFSSPVMIELEGQQQIVYLTRTEVVGLDAANGQLLWRREHPTRFGLNIAVPMWSQGNLLFVSSAYDGGSRVLRLAKNNGVTEVEELWAHQQMRLHIGNALRVGDLVIASNGDFGPVPLTAVNIHSGEIAWRIRDVARAFALYADGKLVLLDEDGVLTLATPSAKGLEIHAQHDLFEQRAWSPPTLVGRRLFARDTERMVALELP